MRQRIYEIISKSDGDDIPSSIYDYFMIAVIFISILPLAFKQEGMFFKVTDKITAVVFIIDYLLRLITADIHFGKKGALSFVKYPFSFMAIVDLVSILPSLTIVNRSFKLLRVLRMIRALRVIRVIKVVRYSKTFEIIGRVVESSKSSLIAVAVLAVGYIIVSALAIFSAEPDSFNTFFDAIYWATISLTTVGYGDLTPVTPFGRIITMISSLFGIAIVALPASILTAGYMREMENNEEK